MTLVAGLVLIVLGVVVGVLQVRWAARSTQRPIRFWRVSQSLPRGQRYASDLAIAGLLLAGAFTMEVGRPEWVFYVAAVSAAAVGGTAQALAIRAFRQPAHR